MRNIILEQLDREAEKTIDLQQHLHRHPELSGKEYRTKDLLVKACQELKLEIHETTGLGFIAVMDTYKEGKTLGIRADMDALPLNENPNNLKQTKQVVSEIKGVMHACGHDGHMSILVSAMRQLAALRDQLTGRIIFIFESGEEMGIGIYPMLDLLKQFKIDAIYGNHLAAFLETGKVAIDDGAVMAAPGVFDITVHGRGGHASRPDLALNPIVAAAQIITSLSNVWLNTMDVEKIVTFAVTKFETGDVVNIIPEQAKLSGMIRYFDQEAGDKALEIIEQTAVHTAEAFGATVDYFGQNPMPPVINDSDLAALARQSAEQLFPSSVKEEVKWYASESFGLYHQIAPSVFSFIGTRNERLGTGAEHHNEQFEIDPEALRYGVGVMVQFALNYLT